MLRPQKPTTASEELDNPKCSGKRCLVQWPTLLPSASPGDWYLLWLVEQLWRNCCTIWVMVFKSFSDNAVSGGYSPDVFSLLFVPCMWGADRPFRRNDPQSPLPLIAGMRGGSWWVHLFSCPLLTLLMGLWMSPSKLCTCLLLHLSPAPSSCKENHQVPKCMEECQCCLLHWAICLSGGVSYSEVIWVVFISGYRLSELLFCITTTKAICWSLPGARTWSGRAFLRARTAGLWILLCSIGFLNVLFFTTPQCLSRSCCRFSVLWHRTCVNLLWPYPLNQPSDKVWGLGLILGSSCSFSRVSNLKLSIFFLWWRCI